MCRCRTDTGSSSVISLTCDGPARSSKALAVSLTCNSLRLLVELPHSFPSPTANHAIRQDSAEAALSLHQTELTPGRRLNVYISNPERKKERSDADADTKEIYVAGLSRFASEDDLKKLFSTVNSSILFLPSYSESKFSLVL